MVLIDDLDGTEADETVTFTIDGTSTEIDLSKQNAANLRKALAEYAKHGRTVATPRVGSARRSSAKPSSSPRNLAAVRKWADEHGFEVSHRGRIPANVVTAYEDAHK